MVYAITSNLSLHGITPMNNIIDRKCRMRKCFFPNYATARMDNSPRLIIFKQMFAICSKKLIYWPTYKNPSTNHNCCAYDSLRPTFPLGHEMDQHPLSDGLISTSYKYRTGICRTCSSVLTYPTMHNSKVTWSTQ